MDIQYIENIPYEKVIAINRLSWGTLNPELKDRHYLQLANNCKTAKANNQLLTIGAMLDGELIGASLLFRTPGYLFYVNGGITAAGKKIGAMNGIIDALIRNYASSPLILDFEGSEIEGVAYFYRKFGSSNSPYLHFKKFNLF